MAREVTPVFPSVPDVVHRLIFTLRIYVIALRKGAGLPRVCCSRVSMRRQLAAHASKLVWLSLKSRFGLPNFLVQSRCGRLEGESEERRDSEKSERDHIIPSELLLEKRDREHHEDRQSDNLLNDLELEA
jgi:hypothetical protein